MTPADGPLWGGQESRPVGVMIAGPSHPGSSGGVSRITLRGAFGRDSTGDLTGPTSGGPAAMNGRGRRAVANTECDPVNITTFRGVHVTSPTPTLAAVSLQISDSASPVQSSRIRHSAFQQKVTSAEEAVKAIGPGDTVAVSGFASAGTPKAVIPALADRIHAARAAGANFTIDLLTGASVSTETERMLAEIDGIALRMPYQAESTARQKINQGRMDYVDIHLSHVAQQVWEGYYGVVNVAVVEVSGITETGELIPSASVGNNKTWLDVAEKVILEVNSWVPDAMDGIHDIYYGTALPPAPPTDRTHRRGGPHRATALPGGPGQGCCGGGDERPRQCERADRSGCGQ